MVDASKYKEQINSLKITSYLDITNICHQEILKSQHQEMLLLFKFHHIMDLVMRLILLAMSMTLSLRNQKLTSSNSQTMTRKSLDIQQDSILRHQKMQTVVSLYHSTLLMILFQSLSQPRRTPVLLRDLSQREESIRMQTRIWSSLLLLISQLVEISKSIVTISILLDVMTTPLSILQPISFEHRPFETLKILTLSYSSPIHK